MTVYVKFSCNGCFKEIEATNPLKREFLSFSGRSWGFGRVVPSNTIEDITPEGWIAYDPYTMVTYCPDCWKSIVGDENKEGNNDTSR